MGAPQLDSAAVQRLMWSDDEDFERAVEGLNMRGLLDLVTALQSAMSEEQRRFDQLSVQLQRFSDPESVDNKRTSAALCSAQMRLARLCTRNMRCFTQQAIRAKKDQWRATRPSSSEGSSISDSAPIVTIHKMSSPNVESNGERTTNGFKESLRFFQSQVGNVNTPGSNHTSAVHSKTVQLNNNANKLSNGAISGVQNKTSVRTNAVPSVDNILSNVRNICATQSNKNTNVNSKQTLIQCNGGQSVRSNSMHTRITPIVSQPTSSQMNESQAINRDPKATFVNDSEIRSKDVAKKLPLWDSADNRSLSNNFNPTFDEAKVKTSVNTSINSAVFQGNRKLSSNPKPVLSESKEQHSMNDAISVTINKNNSMSSSNNLSKPTSLKQNVSSSDKEEILENSLSQSNNINSINDALRTVHAQKQEPLSVVSVHNNQPCLPNLANKRSSVKNNEKCSVKLISHSHLNEDSQLSKTNPIDNDVCKSNYYLNNNKDNLSVKREEPVDNSPEKTSDSFESDYDSKDFVVHKTSFSDDYLEVMSEDAYSSVNEDYEVEHPDDDQPNGPDIPSPDYASDEDEEFQVHQGVKEEYEDDCEEDFVDNSALYVTDPRRYVYYPEDKELEVIPEEDEDDLEDDDDSYSQEDSDQDRISDDLCLPITNGNDSKLISQTECDSGVTDDQRSNSSAGEECYLEDDTDSAKGSLLQPDSCRESPVYPEKTNPLVFSDMNKNSLNKLEFQQTERLSEDRIPPRWCTLSWDPKELVSVLYRMDYQYDMSHEQKIKFTNKEGYLQKLPHGKKKSTYWNPWKTKYIKIRDGFFYCYESCRSKKPSMSLQLMGGSVELLDNKTLGVDDKKGHFVVLRCPSEEQREEWESALYTQCVEDFSNAYTTPVFHPLSIFKDVIVIDLGGSSLRAGVLMASPTLPQIFFPMVCATHKTSKQHFFGTEALQPEMRKQCNLSYPFRFSEVSQCSFDLSILRALFKHVFQDLNVQPQNFKIQLCINQIITRQTKVEIAKILLYDFKAKCVNVTHQAISSLHGYNSKSGIIIDIGERIDVIPIIEGYAVNAGACTLPFGGNRMLHHLKYALAEKGINLCSDVETYLARYVLEQLCYVPEDYKTEVQQYHTNPNELEMSISTNHFFEDLCPWEEISLDIARFKVPEGLFTTELWGLDNPGIHKLVYNAIQECSIDSRKEMARSIYVSGGITLLPGFVKRLETEINKLTPSSVIPKVHASRYRYHMAYIGAWQIAASEDFDNICITKHEWENEGNICLDKWQTL